MIIIFCFLGAYSVNNSIYDVVFTFAFGVLGYLIKKFRFESPPLILAYVLGPLIEIAFRQSMILSDGSYRIFINRPISAIFIFIAMGILVTTVVKKRTFATKIEAEQ
jgi:putative tricarboxylic transport membrane protein